MMADRSQMEEKLNETLSALSCTPKGQLKYNEPWEFQEHYSNGLPCSLETFLSPESLLMFANLDEEIEDKVEILEDEDENSSRFSLKGKGQVDNEAERSPEHQDRRERPADSIAASFDSENEYRLNKFEKESRVMAEHGKIIRAEKFERRTANLYKEKSQSLKVRMENLKEKHKRSQFDVDEKIQKNNEELNVWKEKWDKDARQHKTKHDDIITKVLMEEIHFVQQEEEEKAVLEEEKAVLEEKKAVLVNLKGDITSLYHQILKNVNLIQKKFKNFPNMSFVDGKVYKKFTTSLSEIVSKAENVLRKCNTLTDLAVAEDSHKDMTDLVKKLMLSNHNATVILKMAEEKAAVAKKEMGEAAAKTEELKKEQIRKAEAEARTRQLVDCESVEKSSHVIRKLNGLEKHGDLPLKDGDLGGERCISDKAFLEYSRLQEVLKTLQDSFKDFTSDQKWQKYKFSLQLAGNTPINALSAHSPSHLNDKIIRLVSLLSGNNVQVSGRNVNCNSHPQALAFCKDLVAKKLVMQGAQQVSSNPASAFIYAAVIVGIWSAFPDVGELILAHFHRSFPYLVPYYLPKEEGQSTNDYHKVLGYSVKNEKIEDQDNFLKKFSGIVQLYAAVVSSSDRTDHPHGIEQAWMWLARVLNLKPHSSVTATMLYEFIKVAGHALMKKYGKQFQKLLLVLCKEFVPAIDKVTLPDKRGPTQRLKDFLEECIKSQKIETPKGYLTQRWWQSGHF